MKANYMVVNRAKQEKFAYKVAENAIQEQLETVCPVCLDSMTHQILATMLWVLHTQFGYGATRLNRLKDAMEREFHLMEIGIMGKEYTATMLYKSLKDLGVDVAQSQWKDDSK